MFLAGDGIAVTPPGTQWTDSSGTTFSWSGARWIPVAQNLPVDTAPTINTAAIAAAMNSQQTFQTMSAQASDSLPPMEVWVEPMPGEQQIVVDDLPPREVWVEPTPTPGGTHIINTAGPMPLPPQAKHSVLPWVALAAIALFLK